MNNTSVYLFHYNKLLLGKQIAQSIECARLSVSEINGFLARKWLMFTALTGHSCLELSPKLMDSQKSQGRDHKVLVLPGMLASAAAFPGHSGRLDGK